MGIVVAKATEYIRFVNVPHYVKPPREDIAQIGRRTNGLFIQYENYCRSFHNSQLNISTPARVAQVTEVENIF